MADEDKKPGRYTGEELGKAVKVTAELAALAGGAQLDDNEAQKILMERLQGPKASRAWMHKDQFVSEGTAQDRDLAEIIIDALPANMRNAEVLASIDLRPYLAQLDGKKILIRAETAFFMPDKTGEAVAHTQAYLDNENEQITKAGVTKTEFDKGRAGVNPMGKGLGVGASAELDDSGNPVIGDNGEIVLTSADEATGPVQFPTDDLRAMVQSDKWDLEQLADEDLGVQVGTGSTPGIDGYFPIETGMPKMGPRGGESHKQTIGIRPAINFLQTLTPTEIFDMQNKLAAAGYYDRTEGGGTFTPSDAFDKNTMAAWKLLLTDSVKQNRPVPEILGKGIKTYREEVRKERMGALSKTDPGYMRAIANDLGQSMIGRDLRPDEIAELTSHVQGLKLRRAGYVAGASDNSADGPLPNDHGYTQDDLSAMMQTDPKLKGEQRMNNQNALAYKLRQLMN